MAVSFTVFEGVAVLGISNPPVNALGSVVRLGLRDAIARAISDSPVKAVVLIGEGTSTFPAGTESTASAYFE